MNVHSGFIHDYVKLEVVTRHTAVKGPRFGGSADTLQREGELSLGQVNGQGRATSTWIGDCVRKMASWSTQYRVYTLRQGRESEVAVRL